MRVVQLVQASIVKIVCMLDAGRQTALFPKLFRRQSGSLMVEAVVSVALMSLVGTAVLSGLSTTHISGAKTERQSLGENIARNQMSAIFDSSYVVMNNGDQYPAVAVPQGYSVTATKSDVNPAHPDVQKVTVVVAFDGGEVFKLESVKVRP